MIIHEINTPYVCIEKFVFPFLYLFSSSFCVFIFPIFILYINILKLSGELKNKQRMDVSGIFRQTC